LIKKPVKIIIIGDAKEELEQLNEIVKTEKNKGITKSERQTLLNSINQKIDLLKENPQYGIHIAKNKIPKDYIKNYDINNLWKINLSGAWRLLYTIKGTEIEILTLILDIIDHKKYDKKFNYKKQ
jgi:hypothetical protein